jgi:general secretion pathway protein D
MMLFSHLRRALRLLPLATLCIASITPMLALVAQNASSGPAVPAVLTDKQRSQAMDAYLAGAKALDRREYTVAEKHFAQALRLNPDNHDYLTALALTREHEVTDLVQHAGRERMLGHIDQAENLLTTARTLDPQNAIVTQHPDPKLPASEPWIAKTAALAGAIDLTPNPGRKSFHAHGDLQEVIRNVAAAYGLRPVLDESVPHKTIHFDLEDVPYTTAMPLLLQMSHLFIAPLDSTSILVAQDTIENRQKFEHLLEETIFIPGKTPEQMTELGNIVRIIFEVKQATVQNSAGNLIIRAPEATLNALNLTLADLLDSTAEIMLELKLYSADITHNRVTGLSLPQQIGAYNVASQAQSLVSANQSLVNQAIAQGLIPATATTLQIVEYLIGSGVVTSTLLSSTLGIFGGGITTTGVYATGGATLNFGLNSSDTRSLDDIQLRVGDRQPSTFRVGTRYPITTSTYSTGSTANSSSLAGVSINGVSASSLLSQFLGSSSGQTIPQIQYEDLGLSLTATPYVTRTGSIHMKLDLKIEALSGGSLDNIPILNSRQYVSEITVNDGETALLLSNANRSETRAINGLPGISELPGFQDASALNAEADTSQLVLLLTPHIVHRRANNLYGPRIAFSPPHEASGNPD